jgi:hypothetical protein
VQIVVEAQGQSRTPAGDRAVTTWREMPGQPRLCAGCGKPIKLTGDQSIWFDTYRRESWHWACVDLLRNEHDVDETIRTTADAGVL